MENNFKIYETLKVHIKFIITLKGCCCFAEVHKRRVKNIEELPLSAVNEFGKSAYYKWLENCFSTSTIFFQRSLL